METLEKINILLVDDREENLITLAAVLDKPEYRLFKAPSGKEALRLLMDDEFALILMDVQMPIMDGFETATIIKQRERSKNIPIIFVTANSTDDMFMYRGYGTGAVDYITKPFNPEILRSKVSVFAELHRKTLLLRAQARLVLQNEKLKREQEIARLEMQNLRLSEAANRKYRHLVDGIHHGIVWCADADSQRLLFVSPKVGDLVGYSATSLLDGMMQLKELIHPDDRETFEASIDQAKEDSEEIRFEHRIVNAAGAVQWFQTSIRGVDSEESGRRELRGLSVDISAVKSAEIAAKKAVLARDEFMSIASHELRNPLTPLSLQLQLLKKIRDEQLPETAWPPKLGAMIESSGKLVDRLAQLIDELLDVSRLTSEGQELKRERVDLRELIHDVSQRFIEEFDRQGCTVSIEAPDEVVGFWDRSRIEQVFVNLLTNATKYGAGKPVLVKLGMSDTGKAFLEVQDQGIGIAKEDQHRIFRRYERAGSAKGFAGLGLGLYIAQQIVSSHEGEIHVRSEPGKGSAFVVTLPHGFVGNSPGLSTKVDLASEAALAR